MGTGDEFCIIQLVNSLALNILWGLYLVKLVRSLTQLVSSGTPATGECQ